MALEAELSKGRAVWLKAYKRTAYLFGQIDDLIWLRRGIAAIDRDSALDDRVQEVISEVLYCEYGDGRDVPFFRETVYAQADWYLQHPEVHVPFLTRFLLFRILEGERVPLSREALEWPLDIFSNHNPKSSLRVFAGLARIGMPVAFLLLIFAALGWDNGLLRSITTADGVPSLTGQQALLWIWAACLAWPSLMAVRRLIGEGGPRYSPITWILGHRMPLLARELARVCKEIEKEGYDGAAIAAQLSDLQKRGLVFNSMAYALLRLPPKPGESKFRSQWEEAQRPVPSHILVPDH